MFDKSKGKAAQIWKANFYPGATGDRDAPGLFRRQSP